MLTRGRSANGLFAGLALVLLLLAANAGAEQVPAGPPAPVAQPVGQSAKLVTLQGIRAATVAPGGLAFAAIAFSSRRASPTGYLQDADGSAVTGFGIGNANDGFGLQVTANITSLQTSFADSGHLSLKASHRMAAQIPVYVGLSIDRLAGWGDARGILASASLQLTWFPQAKIGQGRFPLMLTLGAGSHLRHQGRDPAVFFGAGIGLTPHFGTSLAWTGETVTLGTAFRFDGLRNMTFAANLDDVFDQNNSRRVGVSATWLIDGLFGG